MNCTRWLGLGLGLMIVQACGGSAASSAPPQAAASEVAAAEAAVAPAPAVAREAPAPTESMERPESAGAPVEAAAPAPALEPAAVTEPEVPAGPTPRKGDRFRVLIVGDSMAATDFGKQLEARLDKHRKVRCDRRGKSATGLARPDYFDWMSEGARRVKRHNPDLVVVVIGGNDGQDLLHKVKGKRRVFWKGKKWTKAYRARLEAFAGTLMKGDRRLLWIELPAMDRPRLEKKLAIIREVQKQTVADLGPRARYLETRDWFYAKDKLLRRAKVKGYKRAQVLRQEDGIHFTVPGARFFANRVYPKVLAALEIE